MTDRNIQTTIAALPQAVKFVLSGEAQPYLHELKQNAGEMYSMLEECIATLIEEAAESVGITLKLLEDAFPEEVDIPQPRGIHYGLEEKIAKQLDDLTTVISYSSEEQGKT